MKVKALIIVVVVLAGGMVFRNRQAEATAPALSDAQQATILASTLQIAMFELAPDEEGTEPGERGLGTVVAFGGETLILTHDHWAPLTPDLNEVEFRNAQGALMLTLDAQAFMALVVYRDGGTMVLRAPAALERPVELDGLVAAMPGAPADEDDVVWLARRAVASGRSTVEVVAATVTAVDGAAFPASMRLRNVDGSAVIPGDSGGGVWANGRLLGNLWAAGVKEDHALWTMLFGGGIEAPSDLTVAALLPEMLMGVAAGPYSGDDMRAGLPAKDNRLQATLAFDS